MKRFKILLALLPGAMVTAEIEVNWETQEGIRALHFESEKLTGKFVAQDSRKLPKGYAKHGLRELKFVPTGKNPHAPESKVGSRRRHQGMMNLYRVYSATETLGSLRDDPAEVEELPDGAKLTWPASEKRPAKISATWRISGPAQIDLTIEAEPEKDLKNFEILIANYVDVHMAKGIYRANEGHPIPTELQSPKDPVAADLYPFFPLTARDRQAQAQSGRIHSSWKWKSRVAAANAALPIAFAGDGRMQIVLLGDPNSTSALCVTPKPEGNAPPEEWNSVEQHSALYLSLFCRNLKAGERHRAHARLVFLTKSENAAQSHQELYRDFLADISQESAASSETLPFPQNRLRDFYGDQARQHLRRGRPFPEILPAFPGLDGGKFGHWGQNVEANYADNHLNEMEIGSVISQTAKHFGKQTTKAVMVAVGANREATVLFDPTRLTFTDSWLGSVKWESRRFGINSGVTPAGKRLLDLTGSKWTKSKNGRYRGFYRNGEHVVFHYQIGRATIYDHVWFENGELTHSLTVEGELPAGVELKTTLQPTIDRGETKKLALGGEPRWPGNEVVTQGETATGPGPYVVDTLTIPYRDENPFKTPFRVGGFDFLPDGRAAVCTIMGDVWLVDGIDRDLDRLTWKRFAAGLHQALGLVVKDGKKSGIQQQAC